MVPNKLRQLIAGIAWWALSVPIFIKIIGIGLLMTFLFASVAFWEIRTGISRMQYSIHGENALSLALSLAARIEPMIPDMEDNDIDVEVNRTMGEFPDVRYIVVQSAKGDILSHGFTFPKEAPPDLLVNKGDLCAACHAALSPQEIPVDLLEITPNSALSSGNLRAYTRDQGMIMEVTVPIGNGSAGTVRLGVGDKVIAREMAKITKSLSFSLAACVVVGLSLAITLASVLVQPIRNLVLATHRLRHGDFTARSRVYSGDEIGKLSLVFNQMAKGLEDYRDEVQEKEAARQSLIGKIVQAQEEERKNVARELHDQLGQMLSKTLLTIESSCGRCSNPHSQCPEIKEDIRAMIDEVRTLAWNVRPSILDDYGLDRALAKYIGETAKRVGFAIDYQSALPPGLARFPRPEVEVTLYRIVQEAITNIIRHAKATEVSVVLMCHTGDAVVVVEDNGIGFDVNPEERGIPQSLGLLGMKERAWLMGGEVLIDSERGKGTTIRVIIPLVAPAMSPKTGFGMHADTNSDSG